MAMADHEHLKKDHVAQHEATATVTVTVSGVHPTGDGSEARTISISGAPKNSTVDIEFFVGDAHGGLQVISDADGNATAELVVPSATATGTVNVLGESGGQVVITATCSF